MESEPVRIESSATDIKTPSAGPQSHNKHPKLNRRKFLKFLSPAVVGIGLEMSERRLSPAHKEGKDEKKLNVEGWEKLQEPCLFYLNQIPDSEFPYDPDAQRKYLTLCFDRHLGVQIPSWLSIENNTALQQTILQKFRFAQNITNLVAQKMSENGIDKLGIRQIKTRPLNAFGIKCARQLMEFGEGGYAPSFLLDRSDAERNLLHTAKKGSLDLVKINITENHLRLARKFYSKFSEYSISTLEETDSALIAKKMALAKKLFLAEKSRILQEIPNQEEQKAVLRSLIYAYITHLVQSWEYSPAEAGDGTATLPFESISDCTTYVYQLAHSVFPQIPPLVQRGFPDEQILGYAQSQNKSDMTHDDEPKDTTADNIGIYALGHNHHMQLLYPDIRYGVMCVTEASSATKIAQYFPASRLLKEVWYSTRLDTDFALMQK